MTSFINESQRDRFDSRDIFNSSDEQQQYANDRSQQLREQIALNRAHHTRVVDEFRIDLIEMTARTRAALASSYARLDALRRKHAQGTDTPPGGGARADVSSNV